MAVPNQSSLISCPTSPFKAFKEWSVAACNRKTELRRQFLHQREKDDKVAESFNFGIFLKNLDFWCYQETIIRTLFREWHSKHRHMIHYSPCESRIKKSELWSVLGYLRVILSELQIQKANDELCYTYLKPRIARE